MSNDLDKNIGSLRLEFLSKYDPDMLYRDFMLLAEKYSKKMKETFGFLGSHETGLSSIDLFFLSRSISLPTRNKPDTTALFQFLNKQFNDTLASHLTQYKNILEIGAGSGQLTYVLNKRGLPVKATDNFSWKLTPYKDQKVYKETYIAALKRFKPDCVISSWMPYGKDWTKKIRACESVKSYILIGEWENGCTGASPDSFIEAPGWKKEELDDVARFGICRSDLFMNNIRLRNMTGVYKFTRE